MKDDKEVNQASLNLVQQQQQCSIGSHVYVNVNGGDGHGSSPKKGVDGGIYGHVNGGGLMCNEKYVSVCNGNGNGVEGSLHFGGLGGFSYSDEGLVTPTMFGERKPIVECISSHNSSGLSLESERKLVYDNSFFRQNTKMSELSLANTLARMRIGGDQESSFGFQVSNPCNAENNVHFENYGHGLSDFHGLQSSFPASSMNYNDQRSSAVFGLQHENHFDTVPGSCNSRSMLSYPGYYPNPLSDLPSQEVAFGINYSHNYSGFRVPYNFSSMNRPCMDDVLFYSHRNPMDFDHLTQSYQPLPSQNLMHHSLPIFNGSQEATTNAWTPQYPSPMRSTGNLKAFTCEDGLIMQGEDMNYVMKNRFDPSNGHRRGSLTGTWIGCLNETTSQIDGLNNPNVHSPLLLPLTYNRLSDYEGSIHHLARDQNGCRFLQRKFEEGTPQDIEIIFNEIVDHIGELMINPFGNYLVQKLLDICTEEQRLQILLTAMSEPGKLVNISLNMHGTRVVQKLIETVKTRQQVSLVISALQPGFLHLILDLNGNHVILRCLQRFSNEDNKFIFRSAAKDCVKIATHRHGCCVLQRCISSSKGQYRENLVSRISSNGLLLAQDAFGNYVVQYILDLKIPSANENLISQFEGKYLHLSLQKFSSNVVEKCLKVFGEESQATIITELLLASQFDLLLQHPFANYVIKSALEVAKVWESKPTFSFQ
ncbi:hypothetical protein GIB67_025994 [Kingdonia uniflora]|uniref:PUM-HD domain-containing protein n=1 Tax=Kingdonia uniflora TaxID=39325 RepID=A0A7J7M2X2_9MAGN|nr:hypothetical protein GIB67_025994 [Kingdonia uniflora]